MTPNGQAYHSLSSTRHHADPPLTAPAKMPTAMTVLNMRRVLIIQSEMKQYRVPFFSGLHAALQREDIELTVAYSNSNPLHALRGDSAELPPPIGLKVSGRWFFGRFIYQPLWREVLKADLVIVGPEIKYLLNPILLLGSKLGLKTIAFWGLGPNRYPDRSRLAELIKEPLFTCVDWWFTYTPSITQYLIGRGMEADKLTTVYNATDSTHFRKFIQEIPDDELREAKIRIAGSNQGRIGLYCGAMGRIKGIPFLLESARLVKQRCPEFHLVLIGDGPERPWLEDAIAGEPWIHYMGYQQGRQAAMYFKMADVCVLGGTVSLALVDSFAAGVPVVVTDLPTHPPEISYVVDGHNGRIAAPDRESFSNAIVEALSDPTLNERLRDGARESGARITIEAMIQNFKVGCMNCLARYAPAQSIAMRRTEPKPTPAIRAEET